MRKTTISTLLSVEKKLFQIGNSRNLNKTIKKDIRDIVNSHFRIVYKSKMVFRRIFLKKIHLMHE